jgi:PBSX family phage terminase large subunit
MIDRIGEPGINVRHWHFTLDDNPYLDPEFVRSLKAEYKGVWYKRYVLGLWCAAEGAVYDMFDPDVHVVDKLPRMVRYWVGVDYGTTNPTVFLLVGQGIDDRLYVVDEWRYDSAEHGGLQKADVQYSADYQEWISLPVRPWIPEYQRMIPQWVFIDPSAASFLVQLFNDKIPNLAGADNVVIDGIKRVASLLATHRLFFHRRCKATINEMSGYAWNAKAQAVGDDEPLKQADHGPDAIRYVVNGIRVIWEKWLRANIG